MFRRSVADMSSIAFILRKSLKNNILELLRHPGKLVAYLFVAACLLFSALSMALSPQEELPEFLDLRILQGIYFALLMFIVMINLIKGVDSGSTFFSMGDVNMLFISPISPKKILVYGLMKQMGMTVLVACCMVAYGGMAVQFFGITALDAVLLFAGFIVSLLVSQIFTILIYSFCNGSRKRSAAVKRLLYAVVLLVLAYVAMTVYEKGFSMETVCAAVTDPYLQWVPIIGWMTGGIFSAIRGFDMMGAVYFALLAAAALIALLAFLKSDSDYYEDVPAKHGDHLRGEKGGQGRQYQYEPAGTKDPEGKDRRHRPRMGRQRLFLQAGKGNAPPFSPGILGGLHHYAGCGGRLYFHCDDELRGRRRTYVLQPDYDGRYHHVYLRAVFPQRGRPLEQGNDEAVFVYGSAKSL